MSLTFPYIVMDSADFVSWNSWLHNFSSWQVRSVPKFVVILCHTDSHISLEWCKWACH